MADLFAKNGAKVIVADIHMDSARKVAENIGGYPLEVDVSIADSVEQMKTDIFKEYQKIDILVNNAGVTHLPAPMETIEEDEFDRVFKVNCKSVYLTAKYFVPHFKEILLIGKPFNSICDRVQNNDLQISVYLQILTAVFPVISVLSGEK